jgi:phosphatidylinositol alpha-1,6-mannosyltransferase
LEAYPTGLVGHWLARKLRRPHVLTAHGTYGVIWSQMALDRRVYRGVLASAALVCPVSQGTARLMQAHFGPALAPQRLRPILNGNDYTRRVPRREAFERPVPEAPTLLSVGEVKARKGQHVSLAAFARVQERLPQARYFIAGRCLPNEYTRQLQDFVAERGLREVVFLGVVSAEELGRLYRQASVFVLTPQQIGLHFEGFGLVYLEAGAYGLPVVATRSGGVPEAVREGETGFLADPDDVLGLADALLKLLTDPDLARRLGQANRLWAESLTWERCAEDYLKAYREVMGL